MTWTDQDPISGAPKVIGGPSVPNTAPDPSVVPAGTRRADHVATRPPPMETIRGSPVPTATGAPGSHGLSEPPSPQVNETELADDRVAALDRDRGTGGSVRSPTMPGGRRPRGRGGGWVAGGVLGATDAGVPASRIGSHEKRGTR